MTSTLEALLDAPPPLDATTRAEFEDDFQHESSAFLSAARKRAKHGLTHSRLRSTYWRLFLQLLDGRDMSKWAEELKAHRRAYDELLRQYNVKPSTHEDGQRQRSDEQAAASAAATNSSIPPNPLTNPVPLSPPSPPVPAIASPTTASDLKINNPLSTASSSPWQQYFHSTELSSVIKQDLDRTYAESGFYQSDGVQQLMLNVLLVWAKCNPQYEYRQGMNELLAPIVLTVFKDSRSASWQDGLLGELLDRHYAEHDVWALFNKLMVVMAPFFAKIDSNNSNGSSSKPYLRPRAQDTNDLLFPAAPTPSSQSPILLKCHHIHHTLLAQHDPALYRHLKSQDVQPQLYVLRWYRLLFAREFHVIDVCTVWDVLFSQEDGRRHSGVGGGGFLMADYFTVAMLFYVRGQLLQGDNTACLRRLLKFPPVEDMRALIDRALFFTAPQQSQRGTTAAVSSGAAGVDLPSVQQEHIAIQKFIVEYGNDLENSYIDDPLGPLKHAGHAKVVMLADGINKLRSKASGAQFKTMPAAGAVPVVAPSAPLQHSQSASSLTHSPLSSSTSPSPTSASSHSAASLASSRASSSTASHSSMNTVPLLSALQHDMGEKLHGIIHTLTAEYGRVHRARTKLHNGDNGSDVRVEMSGVKVEDEIRAQESERAERKEQQSPDGLNISVELEDAHSMNGHSIVPQPTSSPSAASGPSSNVATSASFDLQLLSSSLAEIKHIADILLGRLGYTPQTVHAAAEEEFDIEAAQRPPSAGAVREAAHSALSPSASHVFFVPPVVDDPKARLAQLLSEKESKEQQQQQQTSASHTGADHLPPHSSARYSPALPFPPVKRNSLSVHPQPRSAASSQSEPSSSSPLSAPIRPSSSLPPPTLFSASTSPSLFDSTASASVAGTNSSARALLSSLLGGEKRSVFEE